MESISRSEENTRSFVLYSEFGAKGDGKTNDMAAIIDAHAYANEHNLEVHGDEGAVYYIDFADEGAVVKTCVDWCGCSFVIDDSRIPKEKRRVAVFNVMPTKTNYFISDPMQTVAKGQRKLDITLPEDSVLILTEAGTKKYIRQGKNVNAGSDQCDILLVDKNGNIDPFSPVIWEYTNVTSAEVIPMDETTLTIRGGTFTTIANQLHSSDGYYKRGIQINRSNVVVDGLTHYVKGEPEEQGAPYSGILVIEKCANIHVRNCVFTGHKTYKWNKPTGTVSQGTYDISPKRVVNLTFENCTQTTDILDSAYWGIMGSNFCKNITLKNCIFSRFDAHMGVTGVTILGCTLGHQCLNAIGSGLLRVEDSTLYGASFINLRGDYGSTWEGDVIIKNCTWIPNRGKGPGANTSLINGHYTGFWNFGYECFMPRTITIEGLHIQDGISDPGYDGIYLLGNITAAWVDEDFEQRMEREGYPYHITEKITVSGFTCESGKKWKLAANEFMYRHVQTADLDAAE